MVGGGVRSGRRRRRSRSGRRRRRVKEENKARRRRQAKNKARRRRQAITKALHMECKFKQKDTPLTMVISIPPKESAIFVQSTERGTSIRKY